MSAAIFAFTGDQLEDALARSRLSVPSRVIVREFMQSDAARKLRVQPSPKAGGLSPEGPYIGGTTK